MNQYYLFQIFFQLIFIKTFLPTLVFSSIIDLQFIKLNIENRKYDLIQMRRDHSIRCQSCRQLYSNTIALDCSHSICISCLSELLLKFQAQEMLQDELQIQCASCSYLTSLAIPLVYKLVRPLIRWENDRHELASKMLVCMDCIDGCFPLQQYLVGKHQSHQVETVVKASSIIKNMLIYASKSLQQNIDSLYMQNEKLLHCKSMLNDVLNANLLKIRLGFQSMKEQIVKKQTQIIEEFQQIINNKFKLIDEDISEITVKIETGKEHLQWISQNVLSKQMVTLNSTESIEIINYIINTHHELSQIHDFEQNCHYKLPTYMELLKIYQNNADIDNFKGIIKEIEKFTVLNHHLDVQKTEASRSLSREYFNYKRQQVLGKSSSQFILCADKSTENSRAEMKLKNIKQILIKKQNSIKKLRSSHFVF